MSAGINRMTRAELMAAVARQKLGMSEATSGFVVCFDPDVKRFFVVELLED